MSSSLISDDLIPVAVNIEDEMLKVSFNGGSQIWAAVARYPRLLRATPSQRENWRLIGRGDGIHWPDIDEDISILSLLRIPSSAVSSRFEEVPALIGDLLKTTQRLNAMFEGRPFTPDGHLVGSIGEVVAEYVYDLRLQPASTPQIDAHTEDGRSVQIKFVEVYNGPFPTDLLDGRPDTSNGQISIAISKLSVRNPSLLPTVHNLASINRWFTPKFSNVP